MAAIPQQDDWIPEDSFRVRLGIVRVALGGLNIKQAATLCGINPETWRRWEDGQSPRGLEGVCARIHKATGIEYRWLIAGGPLGDQNRKFLIRALDDDGLPTQGTLLDDLDDPFDFFTQPVLALA